jgi:hypothetical protein
MTTSARAILFFVLTLLDLPLIAATAGAATPTGTTLPTVQSCNAVTNWRNAVNVSIYQNTLTKTSGEFGWNAGGCASWMWGNWAGACRSRPSDSM